MNIYPGKMVVCVHTDGRIRIGSVEAVTDRWIVLADGSMFDAQELTGKYDKNWRVKVDNPSTLFGVETQASAR